jgi:hypothetical protein
MTIVLACLTCVLALTGAAFARDLAGDAVLRARAQAAADAAALAAVASSVPGQRGQPVVLARSFARRNAAHLRSCRCVPGATDAVVEVAVHGVVASARAVLEPHLLAPMRAAPWTAGLEPAMDRAVRRLLAAAAGSVWLVSGVRSSAEQSRLWADAVARYGSEEAADDWVAPPGRSMHERGVAVDLGGDVERAARLVEELGLPLYRPLANEPWHFELQGARS